MARAAGESIVNGRLLDLDGWPRRSHFEFFRAYEHPFFNICADVRVTALYRRSREPEGPSFFLGALYASLRAANAVEQLRLRLRPEGVWLHDRIHAGSTVLRADETFGFGYFEFEPSWASFEEHGRAVLAAVAAGSGALDPQDERDDLIHYSVLPWIRFTSFAHARRHRALDSVPRIVFGRHHERDGERWMPVSVEAHHALVDGLHVARFLERFEAELAGTPP